MAFRGSRRGQRSQGGDSEKQWDRTRSTRGSGSRRRKYHDRTDGDTATGEGMLPFMEDRKSPQEPLNRPSEPDRDPSRRRGGRGRNSARHRTPRRGTDAPQGGDQDRNRPRPSGPDRRIEGGAPHQAAPARRENTDSAQTPRIEYRPVEGDEPRRPRTTSRRTDQRGGRRRNTTDRGGRQTTIPAGSRSARTTRSTEEATKDGRPRRSVMRAPYVKVRRLNAGDGVESPAPGSTEELDPRRISAVESDQGHTGSRRHRAGAEVVTTGDDTSSDLDTTFDGKGWYTVNALHQMMFSEVLKIAKELGVPDQPSYRKEQVIESIVARNNSVENGLIYGEGVLDMTGEGYGFLRSALRNYRPDQDDIYVSASQVRRLNLQSGDTVCGLIRPPRAKERYPALVKVVKINDQDPKYAMERTPFDNLTPLFPDRRYLLETDRKEFSTRSVDMLAPLGMGQRGLIVAPPRTGKTILLQKIATAIKANAPETVLLVLLIDERPEEVTDMISHVPGEVIASTFDETPERHAQISDLIIDKARRLVEYHHDVVIVLDSITRLGRAFNTLAPQGGKIMSGGVESAALQKPRRFFGSARNVEEGGSLTIVATALIETGSRMDDVIFEEFKGTGNMELHLDRYLAERRIFPAINIDKTGTRKEELLLHPDELRKVWALRKGLSGRPPVEAMQLLLKKVAETQTNAEFLMSLVL